MSELWCVGLMGYWSCSVRESRCVVYGRCGVTVLVGVVVCWGHGFGALRCVGDAVRGSPRVWVLRCEAKIKPVYIATPTQCISPTLQLPLIANPILCNTHTPKPPHSPTPTFCNLNIPQPLQIAAPLQPALRPYTPQPTHLQPPQSTTPTPPTLGHPHTP